MPSHLFRCPACGAPLPPAGRIGRLRCLRCGVVYAWPRDAPWGPAPVDAAILYTEEDRPAPRDPPPAEDPA